MKFTGRATEAEYVVITRKFELILSCSPTVNVNIFQQQENKPTIHSVVEIQELLQCNCSHVDSRVMHRQTPGVTFRKKKKLVKMRWKKRVGV
jgi:hypothetical protein